MMSRTKQALQRSLLSLLAEKPFEKITVRDIAERSGFSRNTFYYYYQDIYAMAEDIFDHEIEKAARKARTQDSWQSAFFAATAFATAHKRVVLNLYHSSSRNLLETYYQKSILTAMLIYVRRQAKGLQVPEQKIMALARFYTAALTGLSAEWLADDMRGSLDALIDDLGDLLDGNIRASLERVSRDAEK